MTGWVLMKHVVEHATSGEYQLLCANHNQIKRAEMNENGTGIRHRKRG